MKNLIPTLILLASSFGLHAELLVLDSPAGSGSLAPALVELDDGRAVMTWLERNGDGHVFQSAIFNGENFGPASPIASGHDWFANWADMPGLYVMPGGDWLAHWLVKSGPATYAYDVIMAASSDEGRTWSDPFSPHDDGTPTEHGFVSYFPWNDELAGVVWLDGRETGGGHGHAGGQGHHGNGVMTLRAAAISADGNVSREALLDERVCDCCQTASAVTDAGPVVIYRGRSEDEIRDIWIVRWQDGQWTAPALVHADGWQIGGCPVNGPALLARGREVVAAWFTMADSEPRVQVARSDDGGKNFSNPITLGQAAALGRVDLAWYREGYVASWLEQVGQAGSLELAGFDGTGKIAWQRSLTSMETGRVSGFPRLAAIDGDSLLVTWTATSRGGVPEVRVGLMRLDAP
ncbi:MAG: sialidase family protein [Wenzhouxiangella sp.]